MERANGVLKAKLAKICAHGKLNWVHALPIAIVAWHQESLWIPEDHRAILEDWIQSSQGAGAIPDLDHMINAQ